jgi:hypothetical protein
MRDGSQIYIPVIKGKKNDLVALGNLSSICKKEVKPLIELLPTPDNSTFENHVAKFVGNIMKEYPEGPIVVDMYGVRPGETNSEGTSALIYAFNSLYLSGRAFTPCYGFERDDSVWLKLRELIHKLKNGFAFRIDYDDLDDVAEETWVQILNRMAYVGATADNVDLLIDLRYLDDQKSAEAFNVVSQFLDLCPGGMNFRSTAVLGSSALKMVSSIPKDGIGKIERTELNIWLNLSRRYEGQIPLVYGDYGIIHPDFSDIGPSPKATGKIRYTFGSEIIYFRGHSLFKPSDFPQYRVLSSKVMSSAAYRGARFSYGDSYIADCASSVAGTGNLGTWVAMDMNHHLEVACRQMVAVRKHVVKAFSAIQLSEMLQEA